MTQVDVPVVEEAHGHRILVFVFNDFSVMNGVGTALPSVGS
jgi:hypothetical protein